MFPKLCFVKVSAKNRDGVLLGSMWRIDPTNMEEAIAYFGSKKALVQAALATRDIQIQAKIRQGSNGSSTVRADNFED